MTTRAPLFASVPHSALPQLSDGNVQERKSVDELFDDLDIDSGFSDDESDAPSSKSGEENEEKPKDSQESASSRKSSALRGAPSLFPEIQLDPSGPAWTKWTSSRVTCLDTAYGTTEDKLDCIWLIAGCEDGSLWIFCSLSLTSTSRDAATAATPARTDSMPNLLQSMQSRPSMSRKSSDTVARRAVPGTPRSPGSRIGSASMAGSHSGHGHAHSRKNRSISLALSGSPNLGSSPAAPRKASATISVSDFDAKGNEAVDEDLPTPPRSPVPPSPSIYGHEKGPFAFEELLEPKQIEYGKIRFDPVAHVTLDAQRSPLVSVKILSSEGSNAHFVALTANGKLFKLACQDGTLLQDSDLKRHTFPRSSIANFDDVLLSRGDEAPWLLCLSRESGLALPVDTSDFRVLISFAPDSYLALLQVASDTFMLEARRDGHLYVSLLPDVWTSSEKTEKRDAHDAGLAIPEGQKICGITTQNEDIIVWSEDTVQIIRLENQTVRVQKGIQAASPLQRVMCLSTRRLALISEDFVQIASMDGEGDTTALLDFKLSERVESAVLLTHPTSTEDCLAIITQDDKGMRRISLAPLHEGKDQNEQSDLHIAYTAEEAPKTTGREVCASVKIDDSTYVVGYRSGHVAFCNMQHDLGSVVEADKLEGAITAMAFIESEVDHVYAGSACGEVAVWSVESRKQLAHSQLFACPVQHIQGMDTSTLLVGADGSAALFDSDLESPLLFPATRQSLERIQYRQGQLLLIYSHGLARLWDSETRKVLKSLDHTGCLNVLAHMDDWQEIVLPYVSIEALSIDLRKLIESISAATSKGSKVAEDHLNPSLRWLLSHYCLPGHEEYLQTALRDHLQILVGQCDEATATTVSSTSTYECQSELSVLMISQRATALRLLIAVTLLRVFLNFPDTERYANEVIGYYATQVGDSVGPGFKDASLDFLADFWLDESNEIRQAARMLFGARIARLTEHEIYQEVQDRQAKILNDQGSDPQGLLILGEIAIAKQDRLSTGTIRNIAYQIARCLSLADAPGSQSISLELCTRGFSVFQNSFDAVKVLRDIFHLATSASTLPAAIGLRNLARQAVLSIASVNAPLFMTVLSFDAVHDQTDTEERAKTLKLIAFMIRKKPVVLFSSLPRLVEMVVRSLDPRSNMRGALQQTATYILSELVKTYPSVAFHGKSQRLAVGTHEGAVVVYDLKTATRLYILESHKKRASALSYSPDGRRLVTVSLEESTVKVWKVGLSLLGLLTPAGPPPQGHGVGSNEAYKTLDFKLASPEEAMMTAAAQLEWLTVDWADERRVKITIRETALTFSVL